MKIRPVRTEVDYEAALKDIERLWGSPGNTPDGDRLDVLLVLVENYESRHHAIAPPTLLRRSNFGVYPGFPTNLAIIPG